MTTVDRDTVFYVTTRDGIRIATIQNCSITTEANTTYSSSKFLDKDGVMKTKVNVAVTEPPTVTIVGEMLDWDPSIHTTII